MTLHTVSGDTTRLQRFTAAGAPDNSFDTDSVSILNDTLGHLAGVDPTGRLLLTAFKSAAFLPSIARVTVGGALDSTYGSSGYASLAGNIDAPVVRVNPDASVVTAARGFALSDGTIYLQKLTSGGTTDPTFGIAGTTTISFADLQPGIVGATDSPAKLDDAGNGRIALLANSYSAAVAVISANGTLDPTFGQGGRAILSTRVSLFAGSFGPTGAVDFLGSEAIRPVFLQHSVDGPSWHVHRDGEIHQPIHAGPAGYEHRDRSRASHATATATAATSCAVLRDTPRLQIAGWVRRG